MEPSEPSVALLAPHSLVSCWTFLPLRPLGAHFAPGSRGACQSNGASFSLNTKMGEERQLEWFGSVAFVGGTLTLLPRSPGLPVNPTGPSGPVDPAAPAKPSGPGAPWSPWKHTAVVSKHSGIHGNGTDS